MAIGTAIDNRGNSAGFFTSSGIRRVLLFCGILSSVLYATTDLLGGLRYQNYSFSSQAISELMAIGSPVEAFVDPLFLMYGVIALAFGVGVFREGEGQSPLRITGALLIAYAAMGFLGPTLFEMSQRGIANPDTQGPHMILTSALVTSTLLAIAFSAAALGRSFRIYSIVTLLVVIVFGALAVPYGARLATGKPTPGFGIIERIIVYTSLLWVALLAIALLRHPRNRVSASAPPASPRVS